MVQEEYLNILKKEYLQSAEVYTWLIKNANIVQLQ